MEVYKAAQVRSKSVGSDMWLLLLVAESTQLK
jgi:hypothetical protein